MYQLKKDPIRPKFLARRTRAIECSPPLHSSATTAYSHSTAGNGTVIYTVFSPCDVHGLALMMSERAPLFAAAFLIKLSSGSIELRHNYSVQVLHQLPSHNGTVSQYSILPAFLIRGLLRAQTTFSCWISEDCDDPKRLGFCNSQATAYFSLCPKEHLKPCLCSVAEEPCSGAGTRRSMFSRLGPDPCLG